MTERMIASGNASICTQAFGSPADPPVLMMMGSTASMLWWPDELCEQLAKSGRFVIRYDNRDTGRSTTGKPGVLDYSIDDMVEDAVAILDGYRVERAHLVGMSLGAMIAQIVALKYPSRVSTVTAISSSQFADDDPNLPAMDGRFIEHFSTSGSVDWSNEKAVVEFSVHWVRLCGGAGRAFDEAQAVDLAKREFRRAINPQSKMNHAALTGGADWVNRTHQIDRPFLVIHGTDDPILSYGHGLALAKAIRGSKMVTLQGAGHELNREDWGAIVNAVVAHTA